MGKEDMNMRLRQLLTIGIAGVVSIAFSGCFRESPPQSTAAAETSPASSSEADTGALTAEDNSDDKFVSAYPGFAVTSESLHDGFWDGITSNTDEGENKSPQLSWEPVEGATTYAIYMIDLNTYYFIHWKSSDITETDLPEGWASSEDFVGPWPPSGTTHNYMVYVFALKAPVERMKGTVNTMSEKVPDFMNELDTDKDGNSGNIIAVGRISGKYTAK